MTTLRDALRELPESVFADLLESEDAYRIVLDLPGVTAETAEMRVDRGRLVVEARREKDVPASFAYVEEGRSLFIDAELPLPPDATGAGATAEVERGVFTVTLPKRDAAAGETIPITSAGDDA
ncbi:Hsp20/alpha crystallin family protein [Halobellus limi]|jgi:HSP20 family molecular chaperone IbpA|uniref:Hsp20/alpha crystallin family protein n=1 Tax=Halobellus limi TaxID=699433 RepID=A0A1H5V7V9_9EURY|nr:Hsp20/alpha crystallin family protein [Halobellus limi]QCC46790.1 Hsp20/alpha crystallin family protein [Halobellus limi]SEF83439.1 Hsp20/alpha crystallin family protein [Halobellus limi]